MFNESIDRAQDSLAINIPDQMEDSKLSLAGLRGHIEAKVAADYAEALELCRGWHELNRAGKKHFLFQALIRGAEEGKTRNQVFTDLPEKFCSQDTFYRWIREADGETQKQFPPAAIGRPLSENVKVAQPVTTTTTPVNSTTATATPIPDRPPAIQAQLDRLPPAPVVEEDNETDDTPTFASLISQPAPASVSYEEALETLRRGFRGDLENFIKAIGSRALEAFVEELGNLLGLDVH
jgi:hypothetical protein